jgi:hypothetical protein
VAVAVAVAVAAGTFVPWMAAPCTADYAGVSSHVFVGVSSHVYVGVMLKHKTASIPRVPLHTTRWL